MALPPHRPVVLSYDIDIAVRLDRRAYVPVLRQACLSTTVS
jgi:hypothetical protein